MNTNLLKNLDFASKINQTEAISEAGKEMLAKYRAYVYANPATCGIVNGFVQEAKNFSFDAGLVNILNTVQNYINENKISWKLASACEGICNNPSTYNYIAKVGVEKVQKLLEMNETDIVSYIKAGIMKDVQYIPEFRAICKEVYNSTVNEEMHNEYTITNPISYVSINENGEQFFSVLGKAYKVSEGKVSETIVDDKNFARINALLESFRPENEGIACEYKGIHGDTAKFEINDEGLTFTKGDIKESFKDATAFREYCNMVSRTMQMNEKVNWMNATSVIAEVFEAYDSIVVIDTASLMRTANGTICAIIEGQNNVNLTVFRSVHSGTSCTNYDMMNEALKDVTRLTGIDLRTRYAERLDEELKAANSEEYANIKEALEAKKNAELKERKEKIALLAEQYKNDPAAIMLLNKAAKELSMLEA